MSGGSIADLKPFLQSNYTTMGIDVGIDKEGHPYVFEINSLPTVVPQLADVAMLRAEYYKYVLDNMKK